MNFEQLSEKYKNIKSPRTNFNGQEVWGDKNNDFILLLRNEETEAKKKYYRMYILYTIGAAAYSYLFIFNPGSELVLSERLMGSCFVAAFLILLILFRIRYSKMKKENLFSSTKEFLESSRERHLLWNKQQLWLIPVILLVNVGATFSVSDRFGKLEPELGILLFQTGFWTLLALGLFMGKKQWRKTKKPILRQIELMLTDFEE